MTTMTSGGSKSHPILREWSPLTALLQQIPPKGPTSFWEDLCLTCIDLVPEFIALGTSVGIVYWYDRNKQSLQKLKFESSTSPITCVKLVSSVEYMLAAGNSDGIVTIFQIPKAPTETIPDQFKMGPRHVERFTVSGVHRFPVSALEWSMNGMKLFSGDKSGLVAKTEIDFNLHLSKSSELLNETREIVQLSYVQQQLLVSTVFRSIICNTSGKSLTQVGSKERKSSGRYGAVMKWSYGEKQKPVIYASRPGLRLWLVDQNGTVMHTLIMKDLLSSPHPQIPIINPAMSSNSKGSPTLEPQFGPVKLYGDGLLVTYNENALYIIDPTSVSVVASCRELRRVLDVAVGPDELLVLEGSRSLIRISSKPDPHESRRIPVAMSVSLSDLRLPTPTLKELAFRLKDSTALPLGKIGSKVASLMETWEEEAAMLRAKEGERVKVVVRGLEATEGYFGVSNPGSQDVSPAEEAKPDSPASPEKKGHIEKLGRIGEMGFDEILFKPERRVKKGGVKKKRASGMDWSADTLSVASNRSNASDSSDLPSGETSEHLRSTVLSKSNHVTADEVTSDSCAGSGGEDTESDRNNGVANGSEPDATKDDSGVGEDMETKEMRLAKLLNLDEFLETTQEQAMVDCNVNNNDTVSNNSSDNSDDDDEQATPVFPSVNTELVSDSIYRPSGSHSPLTSDTCDVAFKFPACKPDCSLNSNFSYGPPSGSSSVPDCSINLDGGTDDLTTFHPTDGDDCWLYCGTPGPLASMSVCANYLVCVDVHGVVHFTTLDATSLGPKWQKTDYMARQVSVSNSGRIVWKVHKGSAYGLMNPAKAGPYGERWVKAAENVACVAADDAEVWVAKTDGKLYVQHGVSAEQPFGKFVPVPYQHRIIQVACKSGRVWCVTDSGRLLHATSPDTELTEPSSPISVTGVALGPGGDTGWIADSQNHIFFTDATLDGTLWQVLISDYIFQPSQQLPNPHFRLPESLRCLGRCPHPLLAAGGTSVLFGACAATFAHLNRSVVTGHYWEVVQAEGMAESARWAQVTAEGVYQSQGRLWILGPTGEVFACEPRSRKLQQVVLDCWDSLTCIAAAPEALWVLTSRGQIFIREGVSSSNAHGIGWKSLDMSQLESVVLVHVSCGSEVVWACDNRGTVYMRLGSLQPPSITDFPPAWVTVDGRTAAPKAVFTKVYVGANGRMVWALDSCRNIYVREAIFPELPIGTSWVLVSGIEAIQLTISEKAVWALSPKGEIYRRFGITETNYIGDYWKRIPGITSVLTASLNDELWAVDSDGRLVHHLEKVVTIGDYVPPMGVKTISNEGEDDEWEILGVDNSTESKS